VQGTKVLIVEQFETLAGVLESQLHLNGFAVTGIAVSIAEAFSLAKTGNPDVILIDTQVQGALTMMSQLQTVEATYGKIIFLGCSESEFSRFESKDSYLIKPFSTNDLIKKICERLKY
jgi:DNA-binding response OmpR family regulator